MSSDATRIEEHLRAASDAILLLLAEIGQLSDTSAASHRESLGLTRSSACATSTSLCFASANRPTRSRPSAGRSGE